MIINIILALICLSTILPSVEAANYYLSKNGSSDGLSVGKPAAINDYNSGKLSWKLQAGDTIYVLGTADFSHITAMHSGHVGNPIIWRGDHKNHKCDISRSISKGGNIVINTNGHDNLRFIGFEISGGDEGITNMSKSVSDNIEIWRCYIHHLANRGVLIRYGNGWTVGGSKANGNKIFECGSGTNGGDVAVGKNANNVIISWNELCGDRNTKASVDGIVFDVATLTYALVEHNKIHDHWREDGIDIKRANGVIVRFNDIYGHNFCGSACGTSRQRGIMVQRNAGASSKIQVYGNRVSDNYCGITVADQLKDETPTGEVDIFSNIVANNLISGIYVKAGSGSIAGPILIANNVIYNNAMAPDSGNQAGLSVVDAIAKGCVVKNNLLVDNRHGQTDLKVQSYIGSAAVGSVTMDYDYYYSHDGPSKIRWSGTDYTIDKLYSIVGQERNGANLPANPFTDPTDGDFTLKSPIAGTNFTSGIKLLLPNTKWEDWPDWDVRTGNPDAHRWPAGAYIFSSEP